MKQADALVAMGEDEMVNESCICVDWREEEEVIVENFAEKLADEELEAFWGDGDSDLRFRYNGVEHAIPLTISPVDRYVAIDSLANVLRHKYEVRLYIPSLADDTHCLLVLSHAVWVDLDSRHSDWVRERFEPLVLGKDYFGGGEIPYTRVG